MNLFDSDTGTEWASSPLTTSISLPDGTTIEIESTGDGTFIIVWPSTTAGGEPRVFSSDGLADEAGFLEEIDYEAGEPKPWDSGIESFAGETPPLTTRSGLNGWIMLITKGDDTTLQATAGFIGTVLGDATDD